MKKYLLVSFFLIALTSCEDVIEMDVQKGKDAFIVEGWITNQPEYNFVKLYITVPYFDKPEYTPVSGASVQISDDAGHTEKLTETEPGKYKLLHLRGQVGRTYKLVIESARGKYEGVAKLQRLSWPIDSVTYQFKKKSVLVKDEGYYPAIYGQEQKGSGDFTRLKIYRNGALLQSSGEINLFNDEFVDGNYIKAIEPALKEPFKKDDHVTYEMWSLTENAYRFWMDIKTQLNNGGLFAAPGNNVRTNIIRKDPTTLDAAGYFGASEVVRFENKVK
jgi:hypothetical protein